MELTFEELLEDIENGRAEVVEYGVYDPTAELVAPDEESTLPRLHFTWVETNYLKLEDEQADILRSKGLPVPTGHPIGREDYSFCWWVRTHKDGTPRRSHLWSCNFRRYGWSATDSVGGGIGYGYGDYIWANARDGGLNCSRPEQVIRDTLVAHMADLQSRFGNSVGGPAIKHVAVRALWQELLDDALAHDAGVAGNPVECVKRNGSGDGRIGTVVVNGELWRF
jgi:hypothetical protein